MKKTNALLLVLWTLCGLTAHAQNLSFTTGIITTSESSILPARIVSSGEDQFFEVSYTLTGSRIFEHIENEKTYHLLSIDGFTRMQIPGAPSLPVKNDMILMPPSSTGHLEILETNYYEYDGYMIHPALQPALDTEGAPEPQFFTDQEVYGKDAFFPEQAVELIDVHFNRGNPIAMVQIRPVQFNPVSGKIRVYTNIEYRLDFQNSGESFISISEKNSLNYTRSLKNIVLNANDVPDGQTSSPENINGNEKNYIIITHDEYIGPSKQLANWKRQLGYSVEMVTSDNWTSESIKSAIQTRYDSWTPKPDYFLIIGDHDGDYAVPGKLYQDPFYGNNFASDLYYACMDGSNDWHPDLAHGRISVSTILEAYTVIDKIINYEKNPINNSSFYQNILNCAQFQDSDNNGFADRRFTHTSEDIREYLTNEYGYSGERIYYTNSTAPVSNYRYNAGYYSTGGLLPSELRTPGFDWKGGSEDITSAINSGKFMVFHRDHGYTGGYGWAHPYYTTFTLDELGNGNLFPVIFSINCHTGEFQLTECFAEKLIRMEDKGAVGVVAAANYSYSGYNDALSVGMIDAIWPDPGLYPVFGAGGSGSSNTIGPGNEMYTMGDVVNQGLYAMEMNWGGSSSSDKYQFQLFHWFGDPAMKIWTANPHDQVITATHSPEIYCSSNSFTVSGSLADAKATLLYNNTLIGQTTLDAMGNGVIPYNIAETGTEVTLTVSKHNSKPYEAVLPIAGSCYFPPAVNSEGAMNVQSTSSTLTGDIIDDFGNSVSMSGIVYSLDPDPLYGIPGVYSVATDPLVTMDTFAIQLEGLTESTTYYFKAFAENEFGMGYGNAMSFTTLSPTSIIPYFQDFENDGDWPDSWSTDNSGVWSMSMFWHGASNPGGYHVYSDHTPSETGTVFSPVFDGTDKNNLIVRFYHYWQADYPNYTQDGYFYGSNDGGNSYPYLIDEWHHDNPAWEEGLKEYDISSWADGYVGIKFKWVVTHNNDWYWEFDEFEILEVPASGLWTGNISSDWNEVGNWHDGIIPDAATDVVIPSMPAGGNYPELNTGDLAICDNLTIEPGAHLYIPPDNGLTVVKELINLAGYEGLVIQSGPYGKTGSLIHDNPGVEGTVQQYLTQMQWHLTGIPVRYAQAITFYLPGQSNIYLAPFLEPENNWGPDIINIYTPLELGRGYQCWVDNNVNQDEMISYEGTLNTGEFTSGQNGFMEVTRTQENGLNLMSNPYPCAIEADIENWDKKGLSNTVWVWEETDGNYLYWNSTNNGGSTGSGTLLNGIIPPMQGFFIYADRDYPKLTIPSSSRKHSSIAFYKEDDPIENSLKLQVSGNGYKDAIFVNLHDSATQAFDSKYDVKKLFGYPEAPQLYSISPDMNLSINSLPNDGNYCKVDLGLECSLNSLLTFNAAGMEFFDNPGILLEDVKTGEMINLSHSPEYSFLYDPATDKNRFVLHFENQLPVIDLLQITVQIFANEGSVFIRSETETGGDVMIYDIYGKEALNTDISPKSFHRIPFNGNTGYYFVNYITSNECYTRKIFIE